jgi:hypothetical protein
MTKRINNMARKDVTHHTELVLIVVSLKMRDVVLFHSQSIKMKMVIT